MNIARLAAVLIPLLLLGSILTEPKKPKPGSYNPNAGSITGPIIADQGAAGLIPWPISGTVGVSNWPLTQIVSGSVTASQGAAGASAWKVDGSAVTQPVSGTFWPATQPVSGTVTANTGILPTLTKGTQGSTGFSTQDLKDGSRSSIMITAEAVAGAASEALVTMTWSAGGAATTTGTSYPVTSGKRLRLQALTITFVATSTTANTTRIRLRENASGTALITSPLQWSTRIGWPSATFIANQSQTQTIAFPDGFELPAGAGLAISHIEAAANGTIDLSLTGFEY